jgi:2-keto-4-pentenoate hydratase/2-oxohepta-3-ene-1,7-dioic acid hydratase in catechol pathway
LTYARFELQGRVRFGTLDPSRESVTEISGTPFGDPGEPGRSHALRDVRLLSPCQPSKIFALALNYRDHLHGEAPPAEPHVFVKIPSALAAPGDVIVLPSGAGRVDEEAELVVVMGRKCRGVSRKEAVHYVLGYTCGNDVSARVWQKTDRNWWRAKSSDTFAPVGPWISTDAVPSELSITARVNGTEVQRCSPRDLIFDIPTLVEWISRSVTLEPGDLIYTGTSGSPAELHDGDTVEITISGIGTLSNPVRKG